MIWFKSILLMNSTPVLLELNTKQERSYETITLSTYIYCFKLFKYCWTYKTRQYPAQIPTGDNSLANGSVFPRSNGLLNFHSNGLQVVSLLVVFSHSFVLSIYSNIAGNRSYSYLCSLGTSYIVSNWYSYSLDIKH